MAGKSRKGKLRHISAHIEPMKDSKGNQGYSVKVHKHFDSDGDEGKAMPVAPSEDEQSTFAPNAKQAMAHVKKHASAAMAEHEGVEAEEPDGDEPAVKAPAGHPVRKLSHKMY